MRGQWRDLFQGYLRPHRRLVAGLAVALFATIGLQVAAPLVMQGFVDRATSSHGGPLGPLAALYVAAVVVQQGFRIAAAWLGEVLGWLVTNELRADLLDHVLTLDPSFHEQHTPGELIERLDGDVNTLAVFFSEFLLTVVGNVLLLVGAVAVVWWRIPAVGPWAAAWAAATVWGLWAVRHFSAHDWERSRADSGVLYGHIEERLAGLADVRTSAAEAHSMRGFYDLARTRLWSTARARRRDSMSGAVQGVAQFANNAGVFVLGAVLVRRGDLTLGGAFMLYVYGQVLQAPIQGVGQQVEQVQLAVAGARRVAALLAIEPTMVDGHVTHLPSGALDVSLTGVRFGYGDDPDVLHGVDLAIAPGTVLGLVGRTGCGKSTLARLLVRAHDPRGGVVSLSGVAVTDLDRAELRRRVVLVSQQVNVLGVSVRDNLTWFDATRSDEQVVDVVDRLGLGPWLASLPHGLHTVLGGDAAGLSAGEAQLLALGRALLADPSLVILDEASARLDPATEARLEAALDVLLEGRTALVIAHRLATLDRCDHVAVMEDGRVVEHGPRHALAANPSSRFGALLHAGADAAWAGELAT